MDAEIHEPPNWHVLLEGDGCSWAAFFKIIRKIRTSDWNDSLKPVEYDANRIWASSKDSRESWKNMRWKYIFKVAVEKLTTKKYI